MLHMIGNAHLDPVWLWRWPEGCAEAIATCWSAVDRLNEDAAFVFTRGEAVVYRWIETLDPPLFARIHGLVAERRWVIVGGAWLQPDCNLPSGELMIRQALYGKGYLADRFGVDISVGYNVDSFGHAVTLPMLLRHTGFDSYVFMRPQAHEKGLPGELFDWVSADGSRVRTFRIQESYVTAPRTMPIAQKIARHLQASAAAGHPFMCFYGVGNHGGGPTREALAAIHAARAEGAPVGFSDPVRYFSAVRDVAVPEVADELQFHAIGCYSAVSSLKALNRRAEAALGQAEAAAALAWHRAGAAYPGGCFAALWQRLLFNQFHDTLGGSSLESACLDAEQAYGAVLVGAQALLNDAVRQLARTVRRIDDPRDPQFLLMNVNGADWDGILELQPWTDFETIPPRGLVDEDGVAVPFQYIAPDGVTGGLRRVACRVRIPAFGYRLLRYVPCAVGPPAVRRLAAATVLETDGWRLELDGSTGAILSLLNRRDRIELFRGPGHLGIVVDDPTDTWSHGVDRLGFDGVAMLGARIKLLEQGPVRAVVEVSVRLGAARRGGSRMTTTIVLPQDAGLPVELRVTLDWHERNRLLRLAYPLGATRFDYAVPAGWITRPDDGREVPGHAWVRIERDDSAVVIVNDAKYSYAARNGTLFITAARSPVYAHHVPMRLRRGGSYRYVDQGEQRFTVRLHTGREMTRRDAQLLAEALLCPPIASPHVSRGGEAPWHGQWLDARAATSALTMLKVSEDGQALVLRAVELEGRGDRLMVEGAALDIPPRGIVTARLENRTLRASDGLER